MLVEESCASLTKRTGWTNMSTENKLNRNNNLTENVINLKDSDEEADFE